MRSSHDVLIIGGGVNIGSSLAYHLMHDQFDGTVAVFEEVELLSPEETLKIVPHLKMTDLLGSSFSPGDGYVDPHGVLQGFIRKGKSLRVTYVHVEVKQIQRDGDRITGVVTEKGDAYRGEYETLDLSPLDCERMLTGKLAPEEEVV